MVNDPISMHHTVRLHPNQDLTLRLSSGLKDIKVDPFLEISGQNVLKEGIEIHFKQKSDIIDWCEESTVYLGTISGVTTLDHKFQLCVYMISRNNYKKNVVTVFNPINQIIKLESYQILEVILSDPYFGGSDFWEVDFRDEKRDIDVGIQELGVRKIQLAKSAIEDNRDISDIYHLKARTNHYYHPSCREHHLWIRFDNHILPSVRTKANQVYFVGELDFVGYGSKCKEDQLKAMRNLKVLVNIKNKHASKVSQLLGVKNFGDISENSDTKIIFPTITATSTSVTKSKNYATTGLYGNDYCEYYGYHHHGTANLYGSIHSIRKIDIKEVSNSKLGVNCKAKSLIPVGNKKFSGLIPYDWSDNADNCAY